MKEVTYSEGGSITPEMQAEFLHKYAHLEGIVHNGSSVIGYRYYSYPETGKGFKVTVCDGKVVQVDKMSAEEAKTMVACSKLKFGD